MRGQWMWHRFATGDVPPDARCCGLCRRHRFRRTGIDATPEVGYATGASDKRHAVSQDEIQCSLKMTFAERQPGDHVIEKLGCITCIAPTSEDCGLSCMTHSCTRFERG